jgi:hypothetical protein
MEKKFKILRIVATIWKVIAWIVLVVSVLGGCGSLVFGLMAGGAGGRGGDALGLGLGALSGVVTALVAIFVGILYFIFLYAFSEIVDVMLALEENTRATAEQLKNIQKA